MKRNRSLLIFSGGVYPKWLRFLSRYRMGVLVIMLAMPLSAAAQKQKVTIDVSKVDVSVVFKMIKEQTGLTFMYSAEDLKVINPVSLSVKEVTVDSAMTKLLGGTPFKFEYEGGAIVISKKKVVKQQEKMTFSGVVFDKQGNTMPGVSVILKGTTVGTATDVNGKFTFSILKQANPVLIFSFIGMKRLEYAVKDNKPINVTLEEDASELDEVEVISTGYYDVDKRLSTSAVTSLKAEDILVAGINTLDQMLEGHVPGLTYIQNSGQVGATPRLKIRGTTTLMGSTEPLWVLDGMILSDPVGVDPDDLRDLDFVNLLGNAISGLNPEDIDRIDVLKDASATAIYGPKASNGVIVITTKKGKIGRPSVTYSVSGTYRQRPRYTDRAVDVMNSLERVDYSRELIEKGIKIESMHNWVGYEAAISDYYNGKINYNDFSERVADMETCNTDWLDILMKDTFSHNHTLSLSGGSDHVRYYTSLGISDEHGNIRDERNRRYSALAKVNVTYNKFTMQFSLSGNTQKRNYTPTAVGVNDYAINTSRTIRAYNPDGSLYFYQRGSDNTQQVIERYDLPFNILNEMEHSYNKSKTDQIKLNASFDYKLFEPLKATVQFSYGIAHSDDETFWGEETWYAAKLRWFDVYKQAIDNEKTELPKGGELQLNSRKTEDYSARIQLLFNKYLDQENVHQITLNLIGEINSSRATGFKITRRGYMPDRGMIIDKIEAASSDIPYKAYNTWALTTEAALGKREDQLTNTAGLVGVVSYVYKNIYILNANARIDGSNKFGEKSNKKLNPIWSVSGRWNMHENILKTAHWVNTLGLRASFGYQGNMPAQGSPKLQLVKQGINDFYKEYYSTIRYYPNPFLKWEKTSNVDVGVEFSLFKEKLNGTFSYYYRRTTNATMTKKVSSINGLQSYEVNRGTLVNQGYDFSLSFVPINTMLNKAAVNGEKHGFVWRLDPNFGAVLNQLINKLGSKNKPLEDEITYQDYLDGKVYISGKPLNTFYSYRFKGLSPKDGRPMFYGEEPTRIVDGKEVLTEDYVKGLPLEKAVMELMEHSGCREPFLQGGISNYLGWRNWGLSFNLAYSIGSKVRLFKIYNVNSGQIMTRNPEQNLRGVLIHRWRQPGDELHTTIPGILNNKDYGETTTSSTGGWWWHLNGKEKIASTIWDMYDYSDLRVVSGNYLKLQSISLRFVVPEQFCKKLLLKSAYLSLSGTNLFTICSKELKGQDPSQSGSSQLINLSIRPTYSFQLNVTF